MQFKVPQFLEVEDKIFGPFTFREFIYLTGGAGLCFMLYKVLGIFWGAIPIIIVAVLSGLLTFYRPNNKPFLDMLESGIKYGLQSKLYIWKQREQKKNFERKEEAQKAIKASMTGSSPALTQSKLRDLAWSLDVLDLNKHITERK